MEIHQKVHTRENQRSSSSRDVHAAEDDSSQRHVTVTAPSEDSSRVTSDVSFRGASRSTSTNRLADNFYKTDAEVHPIRSSVDAGHTIAIQYNVGCQENSDIKPNLCNSAEDE